jgi:hypothetical protein
VCDPGATPGATQETTPRSTCHSEYLQYCAAAHSLYVPGMRFVVIGS